MRIMTRSNLDQNFWNFGDSKEDPIHRIHSYPAKFPSFITTRALQFAEDRGVTVETIADIFCGCGTTAVEAKKNGKNFWGCDINPLATLIARVKVGSYRDAALDRYFSAVMNKFFSLDVYERDMVGISDRIKYWFEEETIVDLLKLKNAIMLEIPERSQYRKFFLCAFSNILKPTSRWLTKSIKPQIDPHKSPCDVAETFNHQFKLMNKANTEKKDTFPDSERTTVQIETRNFLSVRSKIDFADLVVTSPPYVSSYDYADIHQLSILWLDFASDYRDLRKNMIGNQWGATVPSKSDIESLCRTGKDIYSALLAVDRRKAYATWKYFVDIEKATTRCWQTLKKSGLAVFVIGNTQYKDAVVNNSRYLYECMGRAKFSNIETVKRKISSKIVTPYRDAKGRFTRDSETRKVYHEEFVVIGRKK